MSDEAIAEAVSLLASNLRCRQFTTGTLQILDASLVAKDVPSLLDIRSAVRDLLRSHAPAALAEISTRTVDDKLYAVEFFVRAFAVVGDVESCLALRYEVLVLRETISRQDHYLQVSHEEWLTFAKDCLDNGFYNLAAKGFENGFVCMQSANYVDRALAVSSVENHVTSDIKSLQNFATKLAASHSVQTQSAEYLKRKAQTLDGKCSMDSLSRKYAASSLFRFGIKKRNDYKLYRSRGLNRDVSRS